MATFRKRANGWRAEVARLGVRESATFPTRAAAVAWATTREAQILANSGLSKFDNHFTLLDALKKYSNEVSVKKRGVRWEQIRLKAFAETIPFVGEKIESINSTSIAQWRDSRLKSVSSGSVRRELTILSSVFNYAMKEWQWCSSNPTKQITWPADSKARDRRITDEEIEKICTQLSFTEDSPPIMLKQELAIIFLLAIETAMRKGEILSLTWDRVYLEQRYVHLDETKNGNSRDVPLSSRAIQLISLMQGVNTENNSVFRIASNSADTLFRKARDAAGIIGLRFHDTRHEATTRLARKLNVLDLARTTGHKDTRSLMIYYNATAAELALQLK